MIKTKFSCLTVFFKLVRRSVLKASILALGLSFSSFASAVPILYWFIQSWGHGASIPVTAQIGFAWHAVNATSCVARTQNYTTGMDVTTPGLPNDVSFGYDYIVGASYFGIGNVSVDLHCVDASGATTGTPIRTVFKVY